MKKVNKSRKGEIQVSGRIVEEKAPGKISGDTKENVADAKVRKSSNKSRDALLTAAMQLFWERGYAETGMNDVLALSRVSAGSMYHFFKTKQDLILGVLDRLAEIMYPALLAPIWEAEKDPIERIFGLLGRYRRAILDTKFSYGCPVGRLAVEVSSEMTEVHAKIAMNFEGWSSAVRKCLEDAGSRLPKGMNLKMLSRFVLTVMEGGVMQSRSYKSIEPFDQAVAQLRDYFDRLEEQGQAEAIKAGVSYWDLPKKKKRGPFAG
jgi:TetR/AcrR family transcriptional regulator, transcriptional repressor for nem operon